ncbi:MAG: Gfo/Idh/MocA family oxidoreductase [Armatimonadota bacterium]|nr:Gfo/Idh/MocA family oxidoreductase [Armatimonadota bacterium]
MPLRVAVVGMGEAGTIHANVYQKHPECRLVAVCDVKRERADAAAALYGCQAFYSVSEMLGAGIEIDAASVCTAGVERGADHYAPTMELLAAGIPVLGEAPICNDVKKAREMVALAHARGLRYAVNLNHRFTPAAVRAKAWCEQGRLGELHLINMTLWAVDEDESSPYIHVRSFVPQAVDVMRYFCGEVLMVQAFLKRGRGRRAWSNVQMNLLFGNGAVGHLASSCDAGRSYGVETLEAVGSEGRFVLREACEALEFYSRRSAQVEKYEFLGNMTSLDETFASRIGTWVAQNLRGAPPEEVDGSGRDALKAQLVADAAIESWETGRVVKVPGE